MRCQWWNNGFQLNLLWETQNCVVTGGATVLITIVVRSKGLRCHWWRNGFQFHLCETQNYVVNGVGTASINLVRNRIALTLVKQRLSITLVVRSTDLC